MTKSLHPSVILTKCIAFYTSERGVVYNHQIIRRIILFLVFYESIS